MREAGYTSEEWKLVRETHKILHDDAIRVTATCVRVPVYVGHSMTANVQFRSAMDAAGAAALLAGGYSLAMLLGAWAFQYIGGLAPCEMCIWQRWPHAAAISRPICAMIFTAMGS